jgi:hypothetical protein
MVAGSSYSNSIYANQKKYSLKQISIFFLGQQVYGIPYFFVVVLPFSYYYL